MTGVGLLVGSLMWALVPEVITEAEYRTGNRPAATVNALAGVLLKLDSLLPVGLRRW